MIDSLSELIASYMAVSSAKSPTLDLTWSGRSFIYIRKSMGPSIYTMDYPKCIVLNKRPLHLYIKCLTKHSERDFLPRSRLL